MLNGIQSNQKKRNGFGMMIPDTSNLVKDPKITPSALRRIEGYLTAKSTAQDGLNWGVFFDRHKTNPRMITATVWDGELFHNAKEQARKQLENTPTIFPLNKKTVDELATQRGQQEARVDVAVRYDPRHPVKSVQKLIARAVRKIADIKEAQRLDTPRNQSVKEAIVNGAEERRNKLSEVA